MTRSVASGALLLLASCVSAPDEPNGCIAYSPAVPLVAQLGRVCATQLDEHWAVSVHHGTDVLNRSLAAGEMIRDPDYDLVFFRHEGKAPVWRDAVAAEDAWVEGNPGNVMDVLVGLPVSNRERASGSIAARTIWYCGPKDSKMQCTNAILFLGRVKHGYSGGPLVARSDGAIVGVLDAGVETGLYQGDGIALPTSLVWAEFRRLVPDAGAPAVSAQEQETAPAVSPSSP